MSAEIRPDRSLRKCRWCERRFPRDFKGAADLWRHARRVHTKALEACGWRGEGAN